MLGMDRKQTIGAYCAIRKALLKNDGEAVGFDYETRDNIIDNFLERIDDFEIGKNCRVKNFTKIYHSLEALDVYSSFAIGSCENYSLKDCYVFPNENCLEVECLGTLDAFLLSAISQCQTSLVQKRSLRSGSKKRTQTGLEIPGETLYFKQKYNINVSAGGTKLEFANRIMLKISRGMLLSESANVELVFQKLNVYSKDMPFQQSPDSSTHDPSTFVGTVLVCLPSEHTGGDVTVRHGQKQFTYSFANESTSTNTNYTSIQFVAFFGDCEYDIAPITSGHSVIMTYSIVCRPGEKRYGHSLTFQQVRFARSLPRLEKDRFENKLNKIFTTATKTMTDQCFGVFLSGDYISRGLLPENLTGHDKIMYEYMSSKNIPVSLEPALLCLSHYEVVGTVEEVYDRSVMKYKFYEFDFEVRLIGAFEDTRHEAHKNIPFKKLPIFNAWGKFTENLKDDKETIQCVARGYSSGDAEPGIIKHDSSDLCFVMLMGPFPAGDVSLEDLSLEDASESEEEEEDGECESDNSEVEYESD